MSHAALLTRRRGFSLAELLVALPIGLLVAGAVLQITFLSIETFERGLFFSHNPSWLGAERVFEFLDAPLKHCGVGLPERWETSLFTASTAASSMPAWARWGRAVSVGNTVSGSNYNSAGNDWGNTLRIVSASPTGETAVKALSLESGVQAKAYLSGAVKSDSTVGQTTAVSWLLFPGTEVPVRMVSGAATASPTVTARADTLIPWGSPVCRLNAMIVYMKNGVLYADFCDSSGAQPLVRDIGDASFRLDASGALLIVKITLASDNGGEPKEVSRSWKVGL